MRGKKLCLLLLLCCLLSGCEGGESQEAAESPVRASLPESEPGEVLEKPRPQVRNNGGNFVQVGEKVWFRYNGEELLGKAAPWGDFLSVPPEERIASTLYYYDTQGDAILEAFPDSGAGPLWYGEGGFYLTRVGEELTRWSYFVTEEGVITELGEGQVVGVSENGRYMAKLCETGPESGSLSLYRGTEEVVKESPNYDATFRFCGLTEEGAVIYLDHSYSEHSDELWQLDPDGSRCRLGLLPARGEAELLSQPSQAPEEELLPEPVQFLQSGERLYLLFSYYPDFSQEYYGSICLTAQLGAQGSLEPYRTDPEEQIYAVEEPRMLDTGDGEILLVDLLPDTLSLTMDHYGDLLWYDSPYSVVPLIRDFLPYDPMESGGMVLVTAERLEDAAYLVIAQEYPEEVWEGSEVPYLSPNEVYYLRVPLLEESQPEPLIGPEWPGTGFVGVEGMPLYFGAYDQVIPGLTLGLTPSQVTEDFLAPEHIDSEKLEPGKTQLTYQYDGLSLRFSDVFDQGEPILCSAWVQDWTLENGLRVGSTLQEVLNSYPYEGYQEPIGDPAIPWGWLIYGDFLPWSGMPEQEEYTAYITQPDIQDMSYSVEYLYLSPREGGYEQASLVFFFNGEDQVREISWDLNYFPYDAEQAPAYG